MPLFGKSTKSPAEVVKALKEAVNALERGDKKAEKVGSKIMVFILIVQGLFLDSLKISVGTVCCLLIPI